MTCAHRATAALAVLLLWLTPARAQDGDIPDSQDPPVIGARYPGARIIEYREVAFDEFTVLTGRAEGREPTATERLEGRVINVGYEISKKRSTLEVMRNYELALKDLGFTTIYACASAECGGRGFVLLARNHYGLNNYFNGPWEGQRYLAARLDRPERRVYAVVFVIKAYNIGGPRKNNVYAQVMTVETEPMEAGLQTVEATEMESAIAETGRVALYGIQFDFDSAEILPASRPALDEIAKLLRQKPKLSLLVVGHTDNAGSLDYNLDLSRRRAAAVVADLVRTYGVAAGRLEPHGVGFLAPVASNATEDGRAQNRRVELVQRD